MLTTDHSIRFKHGRGVSVRPTTVKFIGVLDD
jgi:hypothetical protein